MWDTASWCTRKALPLVLLWVSDYKNIYMIVFHYHQLSHGA